MYSYGPPHMAEQKQNDVRIRDVALKTYRRRWTIGRSGERGSGISVLAAGHDDDDDIFRFCFNQRGDISILKSSSLKLVDKFTYLGRSVSSTETDINTRLAKAGTAIDRLSVMWNSNLTDKMTRSFFQAAVMWILRYGCTTWTLMKCM